LWSKPTNPLRHILIDEYALDDPDFKPLERGYSNQSFSVSAGGGEYILRRGWRGKPASQGLREERVLAHLKEVVPEVAVPRLVPTRSGAAHTTLKGQPLHLFERLPGHPSYSWKQRCSDVHLQGILHLLAMLHNALATMPLADEKSTLEVFGDQIHALRATGAGRCFAMATGMGAARANFDNFLDSAESILNHAKGLGAFERPPIWCHGDFQLENFLFNEDMVAAIVDFDTVRTLPLEMDLAFALFSLTRDGAAEEEFSWSRERWNLGRAYYQARGKSLACEASEWAPLFCLDQALVHLHAALQGQWALRPGIGFLATYNGVLQA